MAEKIPGRSPKQAGFSRRSFLTGSGAAAAATALGTREALAAGQTPQGPEVISGPTAIELQVNGRDRQVEVEPRTTLLDVLRDQLDLTGAKPVSGDGTSGASTVLVDGRPVMASTTLALTVRGKPIETVEGLSGKTLGAIQQAFVTHDGQQCGFCTPGFVMAVRAFLDKYPDATDQQIRVGLNGNLCRCGTYANVIQAVTAVVRGKGS